jgi:hypothetical protein
VVTVVTLLFSLGFFCHHLVTTSLLAAIDFPTNANTAVRSRRSMPARTIQCPTRHIEAFMQAYDAGRADGSVATTGAAARSLFDHVVGF